MTKDTMIGVDLAKSVFYLHGASMTGQVKFRKKMSRTQLSNARKMMRLRWCRFLRQVPKVDRPMKRTIQDEDTQTVYGRVQGQGGA